MKDAIDKLLKLQKKDLDAIEAKVAAEDAKKSIMRAEMRKSEIAAAFEEKKCELETLEKTRAEMRITRRTLEDKVLKYKTQLLSAKRQSDYDAMNSEIERMQKQSGDLEEEELNIMFEIDTKRAAISAEESELKNKFKACDEEICEMRANINFLNNECVRAKAEADEFRKMVPEAFLTPYMRMLDGGKKFPLIAKLNGDSCSGCHIKVYTSPREIDESPFPVCCDHCGRILYAE